MWRSGYDMPADDFAAEVDRLWGQVRPLYEALHCHVRAALVERYGPERVPPGGAIPAHLLGNMWAQEWSNLYPLVAPFPEQGSLDVGAAMRRANLKFERRFRAMEALADADGTALAALPLDAQDRYWNRAKAGEKS